MRFKHKLMSRVFGSILLVFLIAYAFSVAPVLLPFGTLPPQHDMDHCVSCTRSPMCFVFRVLLQCSFFLGKMCILQRIIHARWLFSHDPHTVSCMHAARGGSSDRDSQAFKILFVRILFMIFSCFLWLFFLLFCCFLHGFWQVPHA